VKYKCAGKRRFGGAFTMGIPEWRDCPDEPTMAVVLEGQEEAMPCCINCMKELGSFGYQIKSVCGLGDIEIPADYILPGE